MPDAAGKTIAPQPAPRTAAAPEPARVMLERRPVVATGHGVGEGVVTGRARFVHSRAELKTLRPGEILLAHAPSPDWAAEARRAVAMVTNDGDGSGAAAALARKLGVPAVVGAVDGASPAWTGATLMVCAEDGGPGVVYECRGPSA